MLTKTDDHIITQFDLNHVHPSWRPCIQQALDKLDPEYYQTLCERTNWLPGPKAIFNAFSLPMDQVNYVLFGESPYPRADSANGYAFWDAAVTTIWSDTGLSKIVNRATSLRNIIKMLLIAEGALKPQHTSQADIASLDTQAFVQTNTELFTNFLHQGFLLLNASPVLQPLQKVHKDARAWRPFLAEVLRVLLQHRPHVELLLLGNIANDIDRVIPDSHVKKFYSEHPYNVSFVTNPKVLDFFKPLHLLKR